MGIEITCSIAPKVGFASHQNSVPIIQELSLTHTGEPTGELTLELTASPAFLEPKLWRIDSLGADGSLRIVDRDVALNAAYLSDLAESVTGDLCLRCLDGDDELATVALPIEILARNQWGGCGSMPELLPAFCMPNAPAIDRIIKGASDVLRRAGKPDAIDGYKTRTRSWELASAMWSSVVGIGISYSLPPAGFEQVGQKIRLPDAILDGRVATCLDTALLFAAALEQANLNPLLVLTQGHAFVGVWLQPQEFSQLIIEEAAAVRKRVDLKEMIVFETTLVTQATAPAFHIAVDTAQRQLDDDSFVMAIDIRRARMQKIRPLALPGNIPAPPAVEPAIPVSETLDEAPPLPAFDIDIDTQPETPDDRVTRWMRKLLDLTTRNRLLHLPIKSKSIIIYCPEPALLEDRLAEGKKVKIVTPPELATGGRDAELYEQQNREVLQEQVARDALAKGSVYANLPKEKLEAQLIDLYRKSRSDIKEGGANTLFLAIGFLNWKKTANDTKTYRAPLILVPVKLERKSALTGVKMLAHDDDPRFNMTLLELLRQDFNLNIHGLDGALPQDESGVNVPAILNIIRQEVKEIPGFEVIAETVLGTFSFAKYLMWKDLADRSEQLATNPVVQQLIGKGSAPSIANGPFPQPQQLDETIDPADLFVPLPTDSSQLTAVVASANGHNFVLDGPPGTGKSQTIANMIAHNLAMGRRVLFVAEKMAALDVVYRRLEQKGLSDFCLEVHSNKTSKIEILKQLDAAWETRASLTPAEWKRQASEVHQLRNQLNDIVKLLHRRHSNGLTLFESIGRVIRDGTDSMPRLNWETPHDHNDYQALLDTVKRLELNLDALTAVPTPIHLITWHEWSNAWQDDTVDCAAALVSAVDELVAARDELMGSLQLPLPADTIDQLNALAKLAPMLLSTHGIDLTFAFAPDVNERVSAATMFIELLSQYRHIEANELSVTYAPEACRVIACSQLTTDWAAADEKFWFLTYFAKKKVTKTLAQQGGTSGLPDPEQDLPQLQRMSALLESMDALAVRLTGVPGWAKLDSDTDAMANAIRCTEELRAEMATLATSPDHLIELRTAIKRLVVEANDMLNPQGQIGKAVSHLLATRATFGEALDQLRQQCGESIDQADAFLTLRQLGVAIQEHRQRLKAWCDWCRARDEALELGLLPLVDAMQTGDIAPDDAVPTFEVAYRRWFAARQIDAEPKLRHFVAAEHMSTIELFRWKDDQLSALSTRYIRAKLSGMLPGKDEVKKKDGYGILKHELQKKRRHKPLRQLAIEMGDALTTLAPCMLMSPLSIAQYLPPDMKPFDLVIFDEASQITPWDAIGSIARGKQVVIAGDPRQMPPTSFFTRDSSSDDDDVEEDLESILKECLATGISQHSLDWHYRSRHESLIAFSNHRYYDSKLITFPAAVTRASAVSWHRVDGIYAKGVARTNQIEAKAMVAEVVKRLSDPVFTRAGWTLGIITLNTQQQALIEDLLDKARRENPQIEQYFSEELAEPVVVKNLETVQGDERDLIMLGIGYGPTASESTRMSMNFGPLNRDGGWRRLNVAITRARQEMMIFTSFNPEMIDLNRTGAQAVRDLKHFIEFADRGPQALAEAVHRSQGGFESPFEEAVAAGLQRLGWQVVTQIGVSRFRIDLGIVHPDHPGDYLAGVECDGASYHSSATARDRDKVRGAVLEGLGWKLFRVWSTDWWVDKQSALERLHTQLEQHLETARAEAIAKAERKARREAREAEDAAREAVQPELETPNDDDDDEAPSSHYPPSAAPVAPATATRAETYRVADLTAHAELIAPDRFYDAAYDDALTQIVGAVLEAEAPIRDDLLVQRVSRAHGFKRSGRMIHERVLEIVDCNFHLQPDPIGGSYVWSTADAQAAWNTYRVPDDSPETARKLDEISSEELRAALQADLTGDIPVEVARLFGILRLSAAGRERIDSVIAWLREV